MSSDPQAFLTPWHRAVSEQDVDALLPLLAEDVSLGAPPYWSKLEGRELVHHVLGLILNTIEEFRYRREWCDGGELALEFFGRVGDLELQGIDLISLDDKNVIENIDVVIRPANAVNRLIEVVGPQIASFLAARR